MKEDENNRFQSGWNLQRTLSKVNYRIHTDAIKENIIPHLMNKSEVPLTFASEAEVLNMALFGKTAQEWRNENPDSDGNIRDYATIEQLVILSNLESINALLISQGVLQGQRFFELNKIAVNQMKSLLANSTIKTLK